MSVLARLKPVAVAVVLGLVAGLAYLVLAEERYEAEAKLQVVPLPAGDPTFAGFALPRASGDGEAVATLADLVERPVVVDAAALRLRLDREEVVDALSVRAEEGSNVVTVRARADDPRKAAQLANAVADEFVAERSAVFQGELNRAIARLRDQLRNVPASRRDVPPADALVARLTALRASLGERDPTVRVAGNAVARDRVVWPRPLPVLAAALLGSLALGLAAAALLTRSAARPADAGRAKLAKREAALAKRVQSVTERERAVARRAGELAAQEREPARRGTAPAVPPEPEPSPASAVPGGTWNIGLLERLVAERGPDFPERIEEWRTYLFFLREHASSDGALPGSFDALVEEAFRELLD
jgi:uncharacterized protein involved in exopolysaccharide biosynthesis